MIQIGFIFFWVSTVLTLTPVLAETSYLKWQIKSEYTDPTPGKDKSVIVWNYEMVPETDNYHINIEDAGKRVGYRAELYFDNNQMLVGVSIFAQIRTTTKNLRFAFDPEKPALLRDTLTPANWPNRFLGSDQLEQTFQVSNTVGTKTTFVEQIKATRKKITVQEAVSQNMIDDSLYPELSKMELIMISFEKLKPDGSVKETIRQLWSLDLPMWIYENTPYRVSWFKK